MMQGSERRHFPSQAALALALLGSACVQTVPKVAVPAALRVTNNGQPFAMWDGAPARKVAEAECAVRGRTLRTSIYDSFDAGAWVFVEGCV